MAPALRSLAALAMVCRLSVLQGVRVVTQPKAIQDAAACPPKLRVDLKGHCYDAATEEEVAGECCDGLRRCDERIELVRNALTERLTHIYSGCKLLPTDFHVVDGAMQIADSTRLCSEGCMLLPERIVPFQITLEDIARDCAADDGKAPELQSLKQQFDTEKVIAAGWATCTVAEPTTAAPPTTVAPAVVPVRQAPPPELVETKCRLYVGYFWDSTYKECRVDTNKDGVADKWAPDRCCHANGCEPGVEYLRDDPRCKIPLVAYQEYDLITGHTRALCCDCKPNTWYKWDGIAKKCRSDTNGDGVFETDAEFRCCYD